MYLLNYTEACNKFAQPISRSLRPAGPPRGGDRGDNDPGAHELERGPIQMTLRSERPIEISCKGRKNRENFDEDLSFLFFGDHLILAGKKR